MDKKITIGDKYGPAMKMRDQAVADAYFEQCVAHTMSWGRSREEAEKTERANLGYFAGYYDDETRERVERLFRCSHPVFGSIAVDGPPTPEQCVRAGEDAAKSAPHPSAESPHRARSRAH